MVIFSERYFPLVVIASWGDWESSDADVYLDSFRKIIARKERYVVLSEARWTSVPGAAARKELAEMSDTISAMTAGLGVATAAVLASRLAVGAATAVAWLSRRKNEVLYVTTAAEALSRLQERATTAGLILGSDCARLVSSLDGLAGGQPTLDEVQKLL